MRISRFVLGALTLWGIYLGYLISTDPASAWASLALTPPFGIVAYRTSRSKNIILQVFSLLGFIAHAVGAPYFWSRRANYSYFGSGAVKNFIFHLSGLFAIYAWVFGLFLLIVFLTIFFDRINFGFKSELYFPAICSVGGQRVVGSKKTNDFLLAALIAFIAIPLNIFMVRNRIGITGVLADPLPYRMLGITYYSRLCFIPLALAWLFPGSSRGWGISLLVAAYSIFAGISSASRTVLFLSLMPLLLDVYLNKRKTKMAALGVFAGASFLIVSASRDYTYTSAVLSFSEMTSSTYDSMSSSSRFSPIDIIGGIANRLYGAQDMILSYQYAPPNPFLSFVQYFWSGGRADAVVPDLGRDFYGVNYEGTGLGVGLGTMAYLLMLGRTSIVLFLLGPALIALLLSLGNRCLNWVVGHSPAGSGLPIKYFAAVLLAFSLYSSSLNLYYLFFEVMMLFGISKALFLRPKIVSNSVIPDFDARFGK